MIVILGGMVDYSYFDYHVVRDGTFDPDRAEDYDAIFRCPACSDVGMTCADPDDSYGSFQISCSCDSYFGVEGWNRIPDTDPRVQEILAASKYDFKPKYWWEITLAEFTHYDAAPDRDIGEEVEWTPFPEHKFWLTGDQSYNQTFLTTEGEFHFGYD